MIPTLYNNQNGQIDKMQATKALPLERDFFKSVGDYWGETGKAVPSSKCSWFYVFFW